MGLSHGGAVDMKHSKVRKLKNQKKLEELGFKHKKSKKTIIKRR